MCRWGVWSAGLTLPRVVRDAAVGGGTAVAATVLLDAAGCFGEVQGRSACATLLCMTRTITQRELRNQSGEIMRALDRGENFIVTRNGVPVGELRPVRRRFVARELLVEIMRGAPPLDAQRFRRDVDAGLDQGIEPPA